MPSRRDVLAGAGLLAATAAAGATGALLGSRPAAQRPTFVAGDSLGVGMAGAAGLPCVARVGIPIRDTRGVAQQLLNTPPDARVFLSLGMNDAMDDDIRFGLMNVKGILNMAGQREVIWVGPPHVQGHPALDARVVKVDAALSVPLPGLALDIPMPRYISTLGFDIKPWTRDASGVHFTVKGYRALWEFVNHQLG